MHHKTPSFNGRRLSRRAFAGALAGSASLAWSSALLARVPALAANAGARGTAAPRIPVAATHHGVPYFDYTGYAEPYRPPARNARTAEYLNSLSREEFLRRHYYT